MAKKKTTPKKKTAAKKRPAPKKNVTLRTKPTRAKAKIAKKPAMKAAKKKRIVVQREPSSGSERSSLGSGVMRAEAPPVRKGLGDEAAGQSGDLQGLSRAEDSNSESVEELVEEGQAFEAEVISGVENAPDPDEEEVHTHERPEGKFPSEDGDE
jgi:hypothetical protein